MSKLLPDYVVMGLLEIESCHGYQLLDYFRDRAELGHVWKISTSQLYAILKRLERREWLDGCERDSVDAPIRTVYWLTDAGRAALYVWLDEAHPSASTRHIRTEFLSRLYVARRLQHPIAPIIQAQVETCRAHRDQLRAERDQLPFGAAYLSLDLRVHEMDVILDWINQSVMNEA